MYEETLFVVIFIRDKTNCTYNEVPPKNNRYLELSSRDVTNETIALVKNVYVAETYFILTPLIRSFVHSTKQFLITFGTVPKNKKLTLLVK